MGRPRTPKGRALETERRLAEEYPDAVCALDFESPFELLAATILSAQCTDQRVNMVTPSLFRRYPTPEALAVADPAELEEIIRPTGFFHNKAKSLMGMASALVERFDSEVPGAMEDLVTIPGVGRKTANVVRSVALGLPGLPVDTHVLRLSRRLGLTTQTDPVKVERELNAMIPPAKRGTFSLRLILHGRAVCIAQPRCADCVLNDFCPASSVKCPAEQHRCRSRHCALHGEGLRDRGNPVVSKSQPGSRHLVSGDAGIRRLASLRETAPSGPSPHLGQVCSALERAVATSSLRDAWTSARSAPSSAASTSSRAAGVPLDDQRDALGQLFDSGREGESSARSALAPAGTCSVSRNSAPNLLPGRREAASTL
jgi:endonuclease-3